MSNRIRILFRGPSDGPYCHSGNRALRALEEQYLNAPRASTKRGWIADYQLQKGQKVYNTKKGMMSGQYFYVDLPSEEKPEAVPEELRKSKFQLASWLWERLAKELQSSCVLVITREARGADWRQSLANPSRIGNQPYCDKKKAPEVAPKILDEAGVIFKKMTYDQVVVQHLQGLKWQPQVQPPANEVLKKTGKQLAAEKAAFYAKYLTQKKKKPSPWSVAEEHDPDFYGGGPVAGEVPAPPIAGAQGQAGKPQLKPQKPEKAKPRLGIWI